ncbi:MAG: ABC transporter ATP-binding protein [Desulfobacterales bacterium]|nr:MAG: ABC transporter ATP-binding protein [Desulfobacterales bacterium]
MPPPVLEIQNLSISFATSNGELHAVQDVSFKIQPGETFGLAGESGSGKSTLAYAIMRYLPSNATIQGGKIIFRDANLLEKREQDLQKIWGNEIAMVYQDPKTALNPAIRVGHQIAEVLQIHRDLNEPQAWQHALNLLDLVNFADPQFNARKYPHQLSGGMQQRIIIAMALACDPALLIMDEPTTGLDVTTQAHIIELIEDLKIKVRSSILYITHDLSVIAQVSDAVGIIYAGQLLETGTAEQIFTKASHPYSSGLLRAIPDLDPKKPFKSIQGYLPDRTRPIPCCIFEPRCDLATERCRVEPPPVYQVAENHFSKCFRWQAAGTWRDEAAVSAKKLRNTQDRQTLVAVEQVKKYYGDSHLYERILGIEPSVVKAVDDVSFDVGSDETFALVGESGCGKTTLARCMVRILDLTQGRISFLYPKAQNGGHKFDRELRRKNQIIFQHPDSSLNPFKTIGAILGRPLKLYGVARKDRRQRVHALLEAVKLDRGYINRFPKELSGGEKQRVAIARAFAGNPQFVILDEPVSALDVSIQAAIIDLLLEFKATRKITYLFISHDLSLVRHVADKVAVMYLGKLCEIGDIESVFGPPYHPYTKALLSAIPRPDPPQGKRSIRLEGSIPSAKNPPPGCRFHTRCPSKIGEICETAAPAFQAIHKNHLIACHIPLEILQKEASII